MGIALYGGTYDPLHNGHLRVASCIKGMPYVEDLWIHVNYKPSYKKKTLFSFEERVEFAKEFGAKIIPGRFSFTADVLKWLRSMYGKKKNIFFFVGQEWQIGKFKNAEYVKNNCDPVIIRPNEINIRSTDIREMIQKKEHLDGLVPSNVLKVIKEKFYV